MNKVILMGRLTADPEVRYSNGSDPVCVARFRLAVDRRYKREGEQSADFINCVAFGKSGEHVEKYYRKGIKVTIAGRIQTGSYTDRDGRKVYTTDVVVEEQEFAESKSASAQGQSGGGQAQNHGAGAGSSYQTDADGFMYVPDGVGDDELPFN